MRKILFISFLLLTTNVFSQKKDVGFLRAQDLFVAEKYYEALYEFQSVKTYDQGEEDFKNKYIAKIYTLLKNDKEATPYLNKLNSDDKNLLLGKNHLEGGDVEQALSSLNLAKNNNPSSAEVYYYIGESYFKKKEYELAFQNFEESKRLGFVTDDLLKNTGVCAYNSGNFLEAIVNLEEAKNTLASDVTLNNYLGMSYFNVARKDLAVITLRNSLSQNNTNNIESAETAVNLSLVFDDLEESDSSIFYLKKALEIDPVRVDALYFLGNKFYDLKMYNQSQSYYEKLLKINPNYEKAYKQLANAYFLDNIYDKAIDRYRQSSFFDENSPEELNYIGICYLQTNDIAKAKSYFEEALKVDASFVQAYHNLANLSFQEKNYDEAIGYLSYASQYKKDDADINFLYAKIYLQTEQLTESEFYFKETIRFNPLKRKAYLYLGHLSLLNDKAKDASFYYDILLTFNPEHFDANLYRGIASFLLKDYDTSVNYLNKAKSLNPQDYKTRYQLSKSLMKQKDYMTAYVMLEDLKKENPADKRIYYMLYKSCKALGIKEEAKQHKATIKALEKI